MVSFIQSVIFDKNYFTKYEALKWIKQHKFKHSKIDEKHDTFRFRQYEPYLFKYMRYKKLTNGVSVVIGFL